MLKQSRFSKLGMKPEKQKLMKQKPKKPRREYQQMGLIRITAKGDLRKTTGFLTRLQKREAYQNLRTFGDKGVQALAAATPLDSGETARSWYYVIIMDRRRVRIEFHNRNVVNGTPVAILLQYGHGTRNGGYVVGRDFINPAARPIFDQIAEDVWKKVTAP